MDRRILEGLKVRRHEQDDACADGMTEFRMDDRRIDGRRDAIDDKLVALLRQNARLSLTALSKAAGLSRTAVQARIARLERTGVIVGYQALLGAAVARTGVGAVLLITFSQRPCAPVVAKFRHWPEIEAYYSVTGPVDAFVVVKVASTQALSALINNLSAIAGVESVQSAVIL
jgi:DNA-binding Lrp family transcriptional regulator